jgi:nitrogen fixation/metabolism regulation signal transduction histidine kinase
MLEQVLKKEFSGIGLKMSKQIIEKYGYVLEISNINKGAFIKIKKAP